MNSMNFEDWKRAAEGAGLDTSDWIDLESDARDDMVDEGWEAPYHVEQQFQVFRGDATDEELLADAKRHNITVTRDESGEYDFSPVTDAYEERLARLLWENLESKIEDINLDKEEAGEN